MKYSYYIWVLFVFLGSYTTSSAQAKAQTILGIAKEDHPPEYYDEQAQLWNDIIKEDQTNGMAWQNYYKAKRAYLQLADATLWANEKDAFYASLNPIILSAQKAIPETFDYYYIKGLNSQRAVCIDAFEKAHAIDPDRSEVYGWLFSYYVPRFNTEKCTDLAEKMLANNTYSDANLKWNYNALQSVEPNALLISNGDMDGSPKWVLQYGNNTRPDVLVANKWLMGTDIEHCKKIYEKLGIPMTSKSENDFDTTSEYVDFLAADILMRSPRPSYIAVGTSWTFLDAYNLSDKMFIVGNVLRFSKEDFDNIPVLVNNIENKYSIEHISHSFQKHPEDAMVKKHMHVTYLPGFMMLKEHYLATGQTEQADKMETVINIIAEESGRKETVLNWFKK